MLSWHSKTNGVLCLKLNLKSLVTNTIFDRTTLFCASEPSEPNLQLCFNIGAFCNSGCSYLRDSYKEKDSCIVTHELTNFKDRQLWQEHQRKTGIKRGTSSEECPVRSIYVFLSDVDQYSLMIHIRRLYPGG